MILPAQYTASAKDEVSRPTRLANQRLMCGHLFLLYLGTFCLKPEAKLRTLADHKFFLTAQGRKALPDIGLLVCPFTRVIITVLKVFCDGASVYIGGKGTVTARLWGVSQRQSPSRVILRSLEPIYPPSRFMLHLCLPPFSACVCPSPGEHNCWGDSHTGIHTDGFRAYL